MSTRRTESVSRFIQQTLSELIRLRVKDPRLGFVTITGCRVSKDLRSARVFVSVLGSEEERTSSMDTLKRAASFLRSELASQLSTRHTPALIFEYDDSIERGSRINKLLDDLKQT